MHLAHGRLDLAVAECSRALQQHPQSAVLWHRMGVVQARRGERVQAIEAEQEALRLQPELIPALYQLAGLYYTAGEHVKSVEVYGRLLRLDQRQAAMFRENHPTP
jgi:tetratricopeptide (TPR) repeat protein